jgi:RNA polymerase sigma-70 factor (ECF subfamily)
MAIETTEQLSPEQFRGHLRMLARVGLRLCGPAANKIDASDIVQEVLLQAHVARDQFRGSTEAELEAWLRKILKNKLTDGVRRFGRQKRDAALEQSIRSSVDGSARRMHQLVHPGTSPSQRVWRLERTVRLTQALQTLPE